MNIVFFACAYAFSLLQVERRNMCIQQDLRHELVSSCLKRQHKQTSRIPETNNWFLLTFRVIKTAVNLAAVFQ